MYAPVQKPRKEGRDPYLPLPSDSATIAAWRQRMGTPEAKEIYKERAATAECVNAISRNRGLRQFLVRRIREGAGGRLVVCDRPQPAASGGTARRNGVGDGGKLKKRYERGERGPPGSQKGPKSVGRGIQQ